MIHNSISKSLKFWIFAAILSAGFFITSTTLANCSPPLGGNHTVTSNCSFSGSVNGVDNGNLTINSGVTLTINASQTIVFNAGKSIIINGTIAVSASGAQIKQTNLWIKDQDNDLYALNATDQLAQDTQPTNYQRRNTRSGTTDCNDIDVTRWRLRYADGDGDGYGAGGAVCVGNQVGYSDNSSDCYDANADAFPGSGHYDNINRGDGSWDYNCDGVETRLYGANQLCNNPGLVWPASLLNGSCVAYPSGLTACVNGRGDASTVGCGVNFVRAGASQNLSGGQLCLNPIYYQSIGTWTQWCN